MRGIFLVKKLSLIHLFSLINASNQFKNCLEAFIEGKRCFLFHENISHTYCADSPAQFVKGLFRYKKKIGTQIMINGNDFVMYSPSFSSISPFLSFFPMGHVHYLYIQICWQCFTSMVLHVMVQIYGAPNKHYWLR